MKLKEEFTRYEIARILGARALQISMDAPILLKISDDEMKILNYDSLKIAQKEFESGILPITVHRPMPAKKESKLEGVKEEKIDDDKIIEKEKEIEDEIKEKAEEMGFVQGDDSDDELEDGSNED